MAESIRLVYQVETRGLRNHKWLDQNPGADRVRAAPGLGPAVAFSACWFQKTRHRALGGQGWLCHSRGMSLRPKAWHPSVGDVGGTRLHTLQCLEGQVRPMNLQWRKVT